MRRARTLRAWVHAAIALGSLYGVLWLANTELRSFSALGAGLVFLALAVRFAVNAVGAKRLDMWGWQPDLDATAPPSRFDRCCRWAVRRSGPSMDEARVPSAVCVRVLPPVD